MRTLTWGKYPAQQSDFYLVDIESGRSVIVDAGAGNAAGTPNYNPAYMYLNGPVSSGFPRKQLAKIALTSIRAQVGHSPVLISAKLYIRMVGATNTHSGYTVGLFRLLTTPDWADVDYRYRDISALAGWGGDASIYSPVPGIDHGPVPFATYAFPASASYGPVWVSFDVTDELTYRLAANEDFTFVVSKYPIPLTSGTETVMQCYWKGSSAYYAYLELMYLLPIEGFGAKSDGTIDLTNILDNAVDISAHNLYLGAVERGQTGAAVKAFLKNLGARTLPHLELWDDSPEWSTPAAGAGNTGDGALDHVVLADDAVSQIWTVKFTSATDFQVQALAYRDYATSLNPTFGGTGWTGSTGGDWGAPSGGLTIPAAAWSGTPDANDTFVIYTTGQTTDPSWASDAGDQVQITKDDGGDPDATAWRPAKGRRTYLTDAVTIDGTSKVLPVRFINETYWPIDNKIFLANGDTIDEGVITDADSTSITVEFASASGHEYAAGDKVCTTLPFRDMAPALWALSTGAAGASQANPALIPLTGAATLGFDTGQTIAIQSIDDPDVVEQATILSADDTKITCTAYLANDYPSGSLVLQGGSGEAAWHARPVATPTTVEELKRMRFNVRT